MSEATIKAILNMDKDTYVDYNMFYYIKKIYKMSIDDFMKLDGFSIKKATNLYNAIQDSKDIKMYKLLDSLSIPNIGTTASMAIVKKYGINVINLTEENLKSINGIGIIQAKSYVDYMSVHGKTIQDLMIFTFNVKDVKPEIDLPLVAITGTFPISRNDIIEMIKTNYKYTDKINKNTKLLIVGDNASSKVDKAKKLGIPVKTFEELVK